MEEYMNAAVKNMENTPNLEQKFKKATLEEIEDFLKRIIEAPKDIAKSIIKQDNIKLILAEKFEKAKLKEIEYFLKWVARASKDVAKEIVEKEKIKWELLRGDRFVGAFFGDVAVFFEGVGRASTDVGVLVFDAVWHILKEKILLLL
ncbi:MAG: hypothetical protein ACP6IP_03735 [Candidatus Njordarchaeia archaeon]